MSRLSSSSSALIAGTLTALGASLCCVGPLVLLLLGLGGGWVASLTAMEPLRPYLVGLTLLLLAWAYRSLYREPRLCAPGSPCADPRTLRLRRIVFWAVTVVLAGLLALPWLLSAIL